MSDQIGVRAEVMEVSNLNVDEVRISDYLKFAFFCMLLIIPLYAIIRSAINNDWLMMVIDALLVPIGFIHGLLLLAGVVS